MGGGDIAGDIAIDPHICMLQELTKVLATISGDREEVISTWGIDASFGTGGVVTSNPSVAGSPGDYAGG